MSFWGGYKTFGPSESDITGLVDAQRRANRGNYDAAFSDGLRRLSQGASNRGLGQSGAVAMGVPSLHRNVQQQASSDEAGLMGLAQSLRNSRTQVYQPGVGQQLLGAGLNVGGQALGAYLSGGASIPAQLLAQLGQSQGLQRSNAQGAGIFGAGW